MKTADFHKQRKYRDMRKAGKTVTRADAKKLGISTYIGKPCRHGHGGVRYTANGCCVSCNTRGKRYPAQKARVEGEVSMKVKIDRLKDEREPDYWEDML